HWGLSTASGNIIAFAVGVRLEAAAAALPAASRADARACPREYAAAGHPTRPAFWPSPRAPLSTVSAVHPCRRGGAGQPRGPIDRGAVRCHAPAGSSRGGARGPPLPDRGTQDGRFVRSALTR